MGDSSESGGAYREFDPQYNQDLLNSIDDVLREARRSEGDQRFTSLRKLSLLTARTAEVYYKFIDERPHVFDPEFDFPHERPLHELEYQNELEHPSALEERMQALGTRFSMLVQRILEDVMPAVRRLPASGPTTHSALQSLSRLTEIITSTEKTLTTSDDDQIVPMKVVVLDKIPLEIAVADFDETVYRDFFEARTGAQDGERTLQFAYFAPDKQGGEQPIRTSVRGLFHVRITQVKLLKTVYIDHRLLLQQLGERFDLHADPDLREYVAQRFAARKRAGKSPLAALQDVVAFLKRYLQAFTVATPYDAIDPDASFSRNYLTRTFPRALTGQRIHDCAVFALRIANVLTPLVRDQPWRLRFLRSPYHVDIVLTREREEPRGPPELPLLFNFSGLLYGAPQVVEEDEDDEQSAGMAATYATWLSRGPADAIEQFLADLILGSHHTTTFPEWAPGGELGYQGTGVPTPYRFATATPPDGEDATEWLWTRFRDSEVAASVFDTDGGPNARRSAQAYLRYQDRLRSFYNAKVRTFRNVTLANRLDDYEERKLSFDKFKRELQAQYASLISDPYSSMQERMADAVSDSVAPVRVRDGQWVDEDPTLVRSSPQTFVGEPDRPKRGWSWAKDLYIYFKKMKEIEENRDVNVPPKFPGYSPRDY